MKTPSADSTTTQPVAASPAVAREPEFIRLPRNGERCPLSGLSRSLLNSLILGDKPPVRSVVLRQRGKVKGVRLIVWASLKAYLYQQEQVSA